jgi:hypothetical protein
VWSAKRRGGCGRVGDAMAWRCRSNGNVFFNLELKNVSYCQDDHRGNNIFCFIAKEKANSPKCCFAFKSYNQAYEIMNTIGSIFSKARQTPAVPRIGSGLFLFRCLFWGCGRVGAQAASDTQKGGGSADVEAMRRELEKQVSNPRALQGSPAGVCSPACSHPATHAGLGGGVCVLESGKRDPSAPALAARWWRAWPGTCCRCRCRRTACEQAPTHRVSTSGCESARCVCMCACACACACAHACVSGFFLTFGGWLAVVLAGPRPGTRWRHLARGARDAQHGTSL